MVLKHSLILIGIIISYIVLINLVAVVSQFNGFSYTTNKEQINSGGGVNVGVGESVSVMVQRNRWYGKIIENVGDDSKISYVYLFNFLRLPLASGSFNFVYLHVIMLIAIVPVSIFIFRRKKDRFYVPF